MIIHIPEVCTVGFLCNGGVNMFTPSAGDTGANMIVDCYICTDFAFACELDVVELCGLK